MRVLTIVIPDSLENLPGEQVSRLLADSKEVAAFAKTVEAFVRAKIESQQPIPGWALVPGRRSREWLSEEGAKAALAQQGINDPYKHTLLSVAEAEQKVADPDKLKSAWKWAPGNPALKPSGVIPTPAPKSINFGF